MDDNPGLNPQEQHIPTVYAGQKRTRLHPHSVANGLDDTDRFPASKRFKPVVECLIQAQRQNHLGISENAHPTVHPPNINLDPLNTQFNTSGPNQVAAHTEGMDGLQDTSTPSHNTALSHSQAGPYPQQTQSVNHPPFPEETSELLNPETVCEDPQVVFATSPSSSIIPVGQPILSTDPNPLTDAVEIPSSPPNLRNEPIPSSYATGWNKSISEDIVSVDGTHTGEEISFGRVEGDMERLERTSTYQSFAEGSMLSDAEEVGEDVTEEAEAPDVDDELFSASLISNTAAFISDNLGIMDVQSSSQLYFADPGNGGEDASTIDFEDARYHYGADVDYLGVNELSDVFSAPSPSSANSNLFHVPHPDYQPVPGLSGELTDTKERHNLRLYLDNDHDTDCSSTSSPNGLPLALIEDTPFPPGDECVIRVFNDIDPYSTEGWNYGIAGAADAAAAALPTLGEGQEREDSGDRTIGVEHENYASSTSTSLEDEEDLAMETTVPARYSVQYFAENHTHGNLEVSNASSVSDNSGIRNPESSSLVNHFDCGNGVEEAPSDNLHHLLHISQDARSLSNVGIHAKPQSVSGLSEGPGRGPSSERTHTNNGPYPILNQDEAHNEQPISRSTDVLPTAPIESTFPFVPDVLSSPPLESTFPSVNPDFTSDVSQTVNLQSSSQLDHTTGVSDVENTGRFSLDDAHYHYGYDANTTVDQFPEDRTSALIHLQAALGLSDEHSSEPMNTNEGPYARPNNDCGHEQLFSSSSVPIDRYEWSGESMDTNEGPNNNHSYEQSIPSSYAPPGVSPAAPINPWGYINEPTNANEGSTDNCGYEQSITSSHASPEVLPAAPIDPYEYTGEPIISNEGPYTGPNDDFGYEYTGEPMNTNERPNDNRGYEQSIPSSYAPAAPINPYEYINEPTNANEGSTDNRGYEQSIPSSSASPGVLPAAPIDPYEWSGEPMNTNEGSNDVCGHKQSIPSSHASPEVLPAAPIDPYEYTGEPIISIDNRGYEQSIPSSSASPGVLPAASIDPYEWSGEPMNTNEGSNEEYGYKQSIPFSHASPEVLPAAPIHPYEYTAEPMNITEGPYAGPKDDCDYKQSIPSSSASPEVLPSAPNDPSVCYWNDSADHTHDALDDIGPRSNHDVFFDLGWSHGITQVADTANTSTPIDISHSSVWNNANHHYTSDVVDPYSDCNANHNLQGYTPWTEVDDTSKPYFGVHEEQTEQNRAWNTNEIPDLVTPSCPDIFSDANAGNPISYQQSVGVDESYGAPMDLSNDATTPVAHFSNEQLDTFVSAPQQFPSPPPGFPIIEHHGLRTTNAHSNIRPEYKRVIIEEIPDPDAAPDPLNNLKPDEPIILPNTTASGHPTHARVSEHVGGAERGQPHSHTHYSGTSNKDPSCEPHGCNDVPKDENVGGNGPRLNFYDSGGFLQPETTNNEYTRGLSPLTEIPSTPPPQTHTFPRTSEALDYLKGELLSLIQNGVKSPSMKTHFRSQMDVSNLDLETLQGILHRCYHYVGAYSKHAPPPASTSQHSCDDGHISPDSGPPPKLYEPPKHRSEARNRLAELVRRETGILLGTLVLDQALAEPIVSTEKLLCTVSQGTVTDFKEKRHAGPTINNFLLQLGDKGKRTKWNQRAAEVFCAHFRTIEGCENYRRKDVYECFMGHLTQLKRDYAHQGNAKSSQDKDNEQRNRRLARRQTLLQRRITMFAKIYHYHQGPLGELAQFVRHLNLDCMSGDETGSDGKFYKTTVEWRSQELADFLNLLSAWYLSERYLGGGKYSPGEMPRPRYSSNRVEQVLQPDAATSQLPINWYNSSWLAEYEERQNLLSPLPAVSLRLPDPITREAKRFLQVKVRSDVPLHPNHPLLN